MASWPAPLASSRGVTPARITAPASSDLRRAEQWTAAVRWTSLLSIPTPRRCSDAADLRRDVGHRGVADLVGGGADVESQLAASGNDVDGPIGHGQLAHRSNQSGHPRAPPLDIEHQLGRSRGGIVASSHRYGACVSGCPGDRRPGSGRSRRSRSRCRPASLPRAGPGLARCGLRDSRPGRRRVVRARGFFPARNPAFRITSPSLWPSASRRSSSLESNRPATALLPRKLEEKRTPSSSENAMTSR